MKTKVQIVQELLDKQLIKAEDAIVLLTKEVEIQYVHWGVYPTFPQPYQPIWQVFPDFRPMSMDVTTASDNIIYNNCTN